MPLIRILLTGRGPTQVARLVMAVVVDAVDGMLRRQPRTDGCEQIGFEPHVIRPPRRVHGDAAAAVVFVTAVVRVEAPRFDVAPQHVERGVVPVTGSPVCPRTAHPGFRHTRFGVRAARATRLLRDGHAGARQRAHPTKAIPARIAAIPGVAALHSPCRHIERRAARARRIRFRHVVQCNSQRPQESVVMKISMNAPFTSGCSTVPGRCTSGVYCSPPACAAVVPSIGVSAKSSTIARRHHT